MSGLCFAFRQETSPPTIVPEMLLAVLALIFFMLSQAVVGHFWNGEGANARIYAKQSKKPNAIVPEAVRFGGNQAAANRGCHCKQDDPCPFYQSTALSLPFLRLRKRTK